MDRDSQHGIALVTAEKDPSPAGRGSSVCPGYHSRWNLDRRAVGSGAHPGASTGEVAASGGWRAPGSRRGAIQAGPTSPSAPPEDHRRRSSRKSGRTSPGRARDAIVGGIGPDFRDHPRRDHARYGGGVVDPAGQGPDSHHAPPAAHSAALRRQRVIRGTAKGRGAGGTGPGRSSRDAAGWIDLQGPPPASVLHRDRAQDGIQRVQAGGADVDGVC